MRSGELARLAGVSTDTLRHYERLGLLPVPRRSAANYRDYPPAAAGRVQLIRRAIKIGFSLTELKTILLERDGGRRPCRHVRRLLTSKIRDIELQIRNLVSMRGELARISRGWDRRLSRTRRGQPAKLLESLPVDTPVSPRPKPHLRTQGA
jgi:DNA-binding transcriptional MerR regulator